MHCCDSVVAAPCDPNELQMAAACVGPAAIAVISMVLRWTAALKVCCTAALVVRRVCLVVGPQQLGFRVLPYPQTPWAASE
jgi:hypothetical protein